MRTIKKGVEKLLSDLRLEVRTGQVKFRLINYLVIAGPIRKLQIHTPVQCALAE